MFVCINKFKRKKIIFCNKGVDLWTIDGMVYLGVHIVWLCLWGEKIILKFLSGLSCDRSDPLCKKPALLILTRSPTQQTCLILEFFLLSGVRITKGFILISFDLAWLCKQCCLYGSGHFCLIRVPNFVPDPAFHNYLCMEKLVHFCKFLPK